MRRENTKRIKVTINCNSIGKKLQDKPKKRLKDKIKEDMYQLDETNWKDYIQDSQAWRAFVLATKFLGEP